MSGTFETLDDFSLQYRYGYGAISPFFEAIVEERRLLITRCPGCNDGFCPPRAHCPTCWTPTTWEPHAGTGVVVSRSYCYWVPINSPVRKYVDLPYVYGLIRLDDTVTCLNALIHVDDPVLNQGVAVGDRVIVGFREAPEGKISDIYFRPIDDGGRRILPAEEPV